MYINEEENIRYYNSLEKAINKVSENIPVEYYDIGLTENTHFVKTNKPEEFMEALEKVLSSRRHKRITEETDE